MRFNAQSGLPILKALLPGVLFTAARFLEARMLAVYEGFQYAYGGPGKSWLQLLAECVLLGIVLLLWRQYRGGTAGSCQKNGRQLPGLVLPLLLGLLVGFLSVAVTGRSGAVRTDTVNLPQVLTLCLISPVSEELVYRGLVLERCRLVFPLWTSVLLSALLFAAGHESAIQIAVAFAAGLLWGLLSCRTKTVYSSCLSHITANTIILVILLLHVH